MKNQTNEPSASITALSKQAHMLIQQGRIAEAIATYERLIQVKPGIAEAHFNIGVLLSQSGRPEEALIAYEQAIILYPNFAQAYFNIGNIYKKMGKLEEALNAYKHAVHMSPKSADSYISCGIVLNSLGRSEEALIAYRRAIQLNPNSALAYNNTGNALMDLGQPEAALQSYDKAIAINPQYANAYNNRSNVLRKLARAKDALVSCDQAILINPGLADAYNNRGNILRDMNRPAEALDAYDQAIHINPGFLLAHNNRGNALLDLGRPIEALKAYDHAIQLDPQNAEIQNNRAAALLDLGRAEEALAGADYAIQLSPLYVEGYITRGNALCALGRTNEALAAYDTAIRHYPAASIAHNNRGNALRSLGRLPDALAAYEQAITHNPTLALAFNNLGNTLGDLGYYSQAESSYRRALELDPDFVECHSNLIFELAARTKLSCRELLEEQQQWDNIHGLVGRNNPLPLNIRTRKDGERLRVGYVSPDLRTHAVSSFFEPLLINHDPSRFEIFCYASVSRPDATTERLSKIAEHWRYVASKTDAELAKLINEDFIDILVDLAGHTEGNRLRAFTYKPAPVQITYLGFFAATGLRAMDYWITDEILHPADTPEQSIEKIYRLSRCSHAYKPPEQAPAIAPCPSNNERVTFGSFSNLSKLTPEVIETWSRVIHSAPGSRLLITNRSMSDPKTKQLLEDRFRQHGIAAEQLFMHSAPDTEEWLATYAKVDIVLDPFPRTGTTTTAEAIWMGLPVVTLTGRRYVERASASILAAVGLDGLVTQSREDYITKAVLVANDPGWRRNLRTTLRERMSHSPICDGPDLARTMESAYLSIWAQYPTSGR